MNDARLSDESACCVCDIPDESLAHTRTLRMGTLALPPMKIDPSKIPRQGIVTVTESEIWSRVFDSEYLVRKAYSHTDPGFSIASSSKKVIELNFDAQPEREESMRTTDS